MTENADDVSRGAERRLWLGATAIYVVVLVVAHQRFGPSHEPGAFGALTGVLFVWLGVLPWLLLWWLAALGYGMGVSRLLRLGNSLPMRLALGAATLMVLTWLTAWLLTLHVTAMGGLLVLGVLSLLVMTQSTWLDLIRQPDASRTLPDTTPAATFALFAAAPVALLTVAVTLPAGSLWSTEAFGYDVLSYHLNLPRQWIEAGAMIETEHDVYGYLPSLIEVVFAQFMALRGPEPSIVYLAQSFHASWALLAAWLLGGTVSRMTSNLTAGAISAGVVLALPWVLITGSLAYNEMLVLGLAAAAMGWVLTREESVSGWRIGVAIGLLVGAATLAKLTAGFMVALPIGLMLLVQRRWQAAFTAGVVGALVLLPFLIRNALWTGNPVFPFATDALGLGHWTPALAERWNEGHGLAGSEAWSLTALLRQWLMNAGYGAIGGWRTPTETQNIARFPREYGVPILWLGMAAATVLVLWRGRRRWTSESFVAARPAVVLLFAWLAFQLLAWFALTHQQSRFLTTSVVPGMLILGMGLACVARWPRLLWGGFTLAAMSLLSISLLWSQTLAGSHPDTGERTSLPPWFLSDAFASPAHPLNPDGHPVNALPPSATVMVVADTSRLFYLQPNLVYASAFDASPLGPVLDEAQGDADRAAALLREAGVTHLWVGWSELRRLHNTYGHDERVTEAAVANLVRGWPVETDLGSSSLIRVPNRR
ncbi:MAG: hypothetical protein AAGF84_11245 [Planctomycetota bacterium]